MSIVDLLANIFTIVATDPSSSMLTRPGTMLVYFRSSSDRDKACREFDPVFKQFAGAYGRVQCGACDITKGNNRRVVTMAQQTAVPITAVPLLVLYVEGQYHHADI